MKGPAISSTSDMPKADSEAHWKARDAMRTLQDAERIKADPKLYAAAQAMAAEEAAALAKIASKK